jgi:hypothetical protein
MSLKSFIAALALGAVATAGWSLAASAAQTNVNVYDDSGALIQANVTAFDWAEFGSGVAKGVGPFGTPLFTGQNFEFLYQSNLVNMDGVVPAGLVTTANGGTIGGASDFQFTIVAKIQETVAGFVAVGNTQTAVFQPIGGTISIFYDDGGLANTQARTSNGTGFDDGTEIARFTLTGGVSNFTAVIDADPNGSGSAQLDFNVLAALDFANPAFLQGVLAAVMDLHFDSNLNYPAGTSATSAFHIGGSGFYPDYAVAGNDIVFKVDGSNTFTTQVPEPATLGLLGAGLLGICAALRRRSAAA